VYTEIHDKNALGGVLVRGGIISQYPVFFILILTIMSLIDYLRDTKAEMRHVSWPTKQQAINYTIIVFLISLGTGMFLGLLDYGFQEVLKRFI
jgi:preprotein translocase subunit SecE